MRQALYILGIAATALAAAIGIGFIPRNSSPPLLDVEVLAENEEEDYRKASHLLKTSDPEEALKIIHQYKPQIETFSLQGMKWLELFIQASVEAKDVPQLVVLFEFFPEIFKEQETASLLVADAYILNNQSKDYRKIRSLWTDRETKVASWFVLDVDQLLLDGRRKEALELLKSRTFNDKADVSRLVRLALLTANEDPKQAWTYLGEAYSKDPQNPDVRSYRAKLLESVGKFSLAHKEYQAASRLDPKNLFLKDQLAEFYLRQKQYPLAMDILKENLVAPSLDTIWVKTYFWNRVTKPIAFNWEETAMPQGRLDPLIQFLIHLDPENFWDQNTFDHLANNKSFSRYQQETFWLKLIDALKRNQENTAYKLLKYNPFTSTSWYPELELALKRVMNYRKFGTLKLDPVDLPPEGLLAALPQEKIPPFFQQLEELASEKTPGQEFPQELHQLLTSKEAFAALFLAAGWNEAGLKLRTLPIIPNEFPDWVSLLITQALEQNRSILEAMEFSSLQKPTPALSLFTAEMMIAGGNSEAALEKLTKLAKTESDTGYRAAWLASLLWIEKKDYERARISILSQSKLVQDLLGQETLARIAYLEGDTALADRLYLGIEKASPEARSYLARKAYNDKDWKRAEELTEQLLRDYPDHPLLKENLAKIKEEKEKMGV